jgi:hypothetical protein
MAWIDHFAQVDMQPHGQQFVEWCGKKLTVAWEENAVSESSLKNLIVIIKTSNQRPG